MREYALLFLILLFAAPVRCQTAPAGWKTIKSAKAECQIAVPPDWVPLDEGSGAAMFQSPTTAIAVVTWQPGQEFTPLNPTLLKIMAIPKAKMFENSTTRIFYQERSSTNAETANAFNSSVPAKGGTCSSHVVALPVITEEAAKKIALSLAAVEKTQTSVAAVR